MLSHIYLTKPMAVVAVVAVSVLVRAGTRGTLGWQGMGLAAMTRAVCRLALQLRLTAYRSGLWRVCIAGRKWMSIVMPLMLAGYALIESVLKRSLRADIRMLLQLASHRSMINFLVRGVEFLRQSL
jgi:hypothetical protein